MVLYRPTLFNIHYNFNLYNETSEAQIKEKLSTLKIQVFNKLYKFCIKEWWKNFRKRIHRILDFTWFSYRRKTWIGTNEWFTIVIHQTYSILYKNAAYKHRRMILSLQIFCSIFSNILKFMSCTASGKVLQHCSVKVLSFLA